jgi:hypothetical protein
MPGTSPAPPATPIAPPTTAPNCLTHAGLFSGHGRNGSDLFISSLGRKNIDSVLWNFQWHKFCGATLCIGSRFKDTDNGFHDAPPILDA